VIRRATLVALLATGAALSAAPASAQTRDYWVASVPVDWNMVPNQRDALGGTTFTAAQTVLPTVVYRRFSPGWRTPERNTSLAGGNQDLIPGPLLRARVGDVIRVHFKNLDAAFRRPHSMHFHGVH
jgi:FtsP/CotA-like multicopper oxidase with cupredoxin domain